MNLFSVLLKFLKSTSDSILWWERWLGFLKYVDFWWNGFEDGKEDFINVLVPQFSLIFSAPPTFSAHPRWLGIIPRLNWLAYCSSLRLAYPNPTLFVYLKMKLSMEGSSKGIVLWSVFCSMTCIIFEIIYCSELSLPFG